MKLSWPDLRQDVWIFLKELKKNHEILYSNYPVPWPKLEPDTSQNINDLVQQGFETQNTEVRIFENTVLLKLPGHLTLVWATFGNDCY
jgi:hypothetical protein